MQMNESQKEILARIRRRLLRETSGQCSIPTCDETEMLAIHYIDGDRERQDAENVLLLCATHLEQAEYGPLDSEFCMKVKGLLGVSRRVARPQDRHLDTRRDFVDELIRQIDADPASYRAALVGPITLSPPWYTARRDALKPFPNYDVPQWKYLQSRSEFRSHDIRLIFTLSPRYRTKVLEYLRDEEELSRYKRDVLAAADELWGLQGTRGPDVTCVDTGIYQIDYVFPTALLSQTRARADVPTDGGWLYTDPELVARARSRFDKVFDANYTGHATEVGRLKQHVEGIRWS